MNSETKSQIIAGLFIAGFIALAITMGVFLEEEQKLARERNKVEKEKNLTVLYEAWSQDTGNPKNLSKEHFRVLKACESWNNTYELRKDREQND